MPLMQEIPDSLWSLFRSVNREIYIDALLKINEEYQYNNYFLSWEVCVQVLGNYFMARKISIQKEESESEADVLEPPAARTLRWLVRTGWLKRRDDYAEGVTNVVIPDYAGVFIDAFEVLNSEPEDGTDIYIQNVYAILFSYRNDHRKDAGLLNTALANTKKLNKVLQSMLHNMDRFFGALLDQEFYGDLLKEHLDGYVEEVVNKKYHILKTTDNFYQYKMDIKNWLREISEKENEKLAESETVSEHQKDESLRILAVTEQIERGFRDIERRIYYMDREHTKYVRATVTRLNYLLDEERDSKGLLVQLLNSMAAASDVDDRLQQIARLMNFSQFTILSEKSLYKRRGPRTPFIESLAPETEVKELERADVLRMNRIHTRYSKKQIEQFIEDRMTGGEYEVGEDTVKNEEDFEKLILAYEYSARKDSRFIVLEGEDKVEHRGYRYPRLTFVRRV